MTDGAAGFVGVALLARELLQKCPPSVRDKHGGHVEKLSSAFAWCATVARELALTDPHFKSREHATFVFIVNRSTIGDPLASTCVYFVPDERDNYDDPIVGEQNARLCMRPSGPRGEQFMRVRMEIEDRRNPDDNPNVYSLVFLDEAEYWRRVPADDVAAIKAAIRECGPPVVASIASPEGAHVASLWGGVAQRMMVELTQSLTCSCLYCSTRTHRRCSRCGRATYCSRECQVQDYAANHRALCETGVPEAAVRAFDVMCAVVRALLEQNWDDVMQ
jgi:hypothetical protein